jgi:hypothetical protein
MSVTKSVSDLTDDEIVDAIASFGLFGAPVHKKLVNRIDPERAHDDEFVRNVLNVIVMRDRESMRARVTNGLERYTLSLTPLEWGKRLAHRNAEDIAKMLAGDNETR